MTPMLRPCYARAVSAGLRSAALAFGLFTLSVAGLAAPSAAADAAGAQDHPLVGRYEGATLEGAQRKGFEELRLPRAAYPRTGAVDEAALFQPIAGDLTALRYKGPGDRSALEVVRNYQAALEAKGFATVFFCQREDCGAPSKFWEAARGGISVPSNWDTQVYALMRLDRPEGGAWVGVLGVETKANQRDPLLSHVAMHVIEERPIELDKVQVLEASELEQAIDSAGRVAIYGLNFDTGQATLRADAEPQLAEIAAFLKAAPNVRVLVVGHTDTVGSAELNRDLSERRAAAVVAALAAQHQIARDRLTAVGVGMAAPLATNRTEAGRARNRRVEIVELPAP